VGQTGREVRGQRHFAVAAQRRAAGERGERRKPKRSRR
jgi:hypothetical protein